MAPVKKSKAAKTSESINSKLQLVVKSGKVGRNDMCLSAIMNGLIDLNVVQQYTLGYKQALKNLRNGKGERHF